MDINSLLSPDVPQAQSASDSNTARKPKGTRGARPAGGKRTSSALSQEVIRSPERGSSQAHTQSRRTVPGHERGSALTTNQNQQEPFPRFAASPSTPGFRPLDSPMQLTPASDHRSVPDDTRNVYASHVQQQQQQQLLQQLPEVPLQRRVDVLADSTSSQRQQQSPRTKTKTKTPTGGRQPKPAEASRTSSPTPKEPSRPPPVHFTSSSSSTRSLADLTMAEGPAPTPRTLTSTALSDAESQKVTDLLTYLSDNSYAYDSHVQLINLLHKGFVAHTAQSADDNATTCDPRSYALLSDMRQAREAMDSRFAVGEDIWSDWLADEILVARSGEERIAVTELCQKAVLDEPASVRLWVAYADWVHNNYRACYDIGDTDQTGWAAEDKELCRELFTQDIYSTVLEQGAAASQWRIDESHLVWNRYAGLMMQTFPSSPTQQDIGKLRDFFVERLQHPHAASAETSKDIFWPIVNTYYPTSWEAIMDEVNSMAEPARKQISLRADQEATLKRAAEGGDKAVLFETFSTYLHWERKHHKRGVFGQELCCGLYERALLQFPTYTDWWLEYIDFAITTKGSTTSILPLIERATRHCPWSGDLWARRILRSDVERKPHSDIEATKHRATNSGLLDVGGMEELMKVLQQWCSYLRRHAFSATATEDDIDTAEVGIMMALEDIDQAGKTIYGEIFTGDPLHRLETIRIKFYTEARRLDDARKIYEKLVEVHKHEADFWVKYYAWEIMVWGWGRMTESHRVETSANTPNLATAVVQMALGQKIDVIDTPERVLTMYSNHFQQHESGEKLQAALIDARGYSKRLANRRAQETKVATAATAVQQEAAADAQVQPEVVLGGREKRKAEDSLAKVDGTKKNKTEQDPTAMTIDPSPSTAPNVKRDREHNTVTALNLPADVQELDVKKFFRDVGLPISINIHKDKEGKTATATVEFESHEDVISAKTRDGKDLNGNEVKVQSGGQNTLYVANYPPEYDEAAICKLFEGHGEVLHVRFPSLTYNKNRRFCYVQFLTHDIAHSIEVAMDGKMLDGKHKLLAKVANPDAKKQRSGATAEGRELFVKNVDREAKEFEIRKYFEQYGTVANINMLKLVNGRMTGTVFVVFATAEEAAQALEANNKPFRDRILHVEVSGAKAEGRAAPQDRARKEDIIMKHSGTSASPDPMAEDSRRGSDVSMASASQPADQEAYKTVNERKIAIFNLPDTVNDARIRQTMETYGSIVKIQLRRGDHGAIVEFATVKDAFNVRQGVTCSALGPDVKTGDVADLLRKGNKRPAQVAPTGPLTLGMRPPNVSRPGQRGGRRGGLGFKRGGGPISTGGSEADKMASKEVGAGRSNADFRAMFEAGRDQAKGAGEDA